MNLKPWLAKKSLQEVATTEKTQKDLLMLIDRDLHDCQLEGLSPDRKFATAYGAALNLANYVIRGQGYRVSAKVGHHKVTFEVATEIIGPAAQEYADYFDLCRRKRNKVDYDFANVVSQTEVDEIIEKVKQFRNFIRSAVK